MQKEPADGWLLQDYDFFCKKLPMLRALQTAPQKADYESLL